jgi:hypothetical protein
VKIADHCTALSKLLQALAYQEPASVKRGDEIYGWSQPADWLDLAASIVKVDVLTAQNDQSLHMCGSAMDYENDRSKLLTQFATSVTVFTFVWGAFESIAKIMDPPSIPKPSRKSGNDSLAARVAFALRLLKPDGVYHCGLANIRHRMSILPEYADCLPTELGPVAGVEAGEGIDLVRRIRNKFAHGAAALPQRDDWDGKNTVENELVRLSSRIVLLTIQMMLRVYFEGQTFDLDIYEFAADSYASQEIHSALQTLHLVCEALDDEVDEDDDDESRPDTAGQP